MSETPQLIENLKRLPLFSSMLDEEITKILSIAVLQFFPPGYLIVKEGDAGDAMYIIKKGNIEIFKESHDLAVHKAQLAVLSDGDIFGEMALVSDKPRNASAASIDDSEIFVLKKTDFDKILSENSSLAAKISQDVIGRMKKNENINSV